jgi:RimJ/RimL family protein N-acetyltransferase
MIELKPFTESDFETFKSWINSVEELFQFAGPLFSFPVTDEQLLNYIRMSDKKPYKVILTATNETVGHCELNYENRNHRLSRILVGNKNLRGQKIGEHIVREMVRLIFEDPKVQEVDLNVFDWNKGAIKCYENVGFRIRPELTDKLKVNDAI